MTRSGAAAASSSRSYVLGILVVVYVFNFVDRQILSILLEPIKLDLELSDTELGFLSGVAFAIFYATLGMPIARIADKTSRTNVIAVCLSLWSLMTALCGLASNFIQLLLARIGVAVGEAGGSPPSHSLISDYFPPESRATALSIYSLGIPIGTMFGLLIGGWINEFFGWRLAFMVVGLPGILLAIIFKLTVREPARPEVAKAAANTSVRLVARYLWRQKSFVHLSIGAALHAFVGYGFLTWNPAFFIRSHGLETGEIGTNLALISGIVGGVGTFFGGWIADKLAPRDLRWYMWVALIGLVMTVPFVVIVYLLDSHVFAFALMTIPTFFGALYLGPSFAATQSLVPAHMRAIAAAVLLFIINIIGLGLGPQVIGIISDLLYPTFASESLRYSLVIVAVLNLVAAIHYWKAGKTLVADFARAEKSS